MQKVAAIQMCSSDRVEDNLKTAEALVKKASEQGALLAVLPEMFVIFGEQAHMKVVVKEPYGFGMIQDHLSHIAQKYNIWIVGGTIPIECSNPAKIKAASILFDNTGKQVARYDKINLFDVSLSDIETYKESDTTEPGNEIVLVDTPVGRLGLCVCFDLRFPHIFTEFSRRGVEIIAAPSAFTLKTGAAHWKLLCRSRAIDTFSYLIGAGQSGLHANGRETYGHSIIVNPWGVVLGECKASGNEVLVAEIDLEYLYEIREQIPRN